MIAWTLPRQEEAPVPETIVVRSPYDGALVGEARAAAPEDVTAAVGDAARALAAWRRTPAYERAAVLARAAALLEGRREELARRIALEVGKPLRDARAEVGRAVQTFRLGAEEATRIHGEALALDSAERGRGRTGIVRRVPRGIVAAITPFNFPLNLAAHKLAPALACGASVVWKPAPQAPLTALALAALLAEAGLPDGCLRVVPGGAAAGAALVEDERVALVSFTGSDKVGWEIRRRAGRKATLLELGGNAAAIVRADADLDLAAARLVPGAFAFAGQVCISVQRIYVEAAARAPLLERLLARTRALVLGDPLDERTDVGPLIDDGAAARTLARIEDARARGARLLCGGGRAEGPCPRVIEPALLEDVPEDAPAAREEAFGPLACVRGVASLEEALALANAGPFGLQAALFTRDIGAIQKAFDALEVGALIVDDAPGFRVDAMPYGGAKASGDGREGVRYAIEAMTERRLLVLPPLG
jgi:glyceraldehyde-3-phosphate dehydrogenase (NADP+)